MHEANLFLVFPRLLNSLGLSYMVTGSVAGMIYGEPRVTHDVDLVLQLGVERIDEFVELFGPSEFYCPPREVIATEITREVRGHFNLIHQETGFKADIYPVGRDELHKWAMAKRRKIRVEETDVWLAPPEYVIIRKLQYYEEGGSEKHLRDIRRMLELSSDVIDMDQLNQMVGRYGLAGQWKEARGS